MSPQCYTLNKFITKPIFFFTITKAYGAFRLKVAWEESTVRWTDQKTPLFLLFFPILLRREKDIHPLEETAMHTGNFLIEQPKKKETRKGGRINYQSNRWWIQRITPINILPECKRESKHFTFSLLLTISMSDNENLNIPFNKSCIEIILHGNNHIIFGQMPMNSAVPWQ